MRRVIGLLLALGLARIAGGQSAEPSAATGFEVSGVVVNARTGEPVPSVTMSLGSGTSPVKIPDVDTDGEGNFRFEHVPQGRFELVARRQGYVQQAYQQHPGGVSTAIVTGEGKASTGLRFTLDKMASIFGTVMDTSGDPVPHAIVMLFRQMNLEGEEKMVRAGQTVANEAGEYELPRLAPGIFAVCANGRPWFAWTRRAEPVDPDAPRPTLDVAYQTTCYPEVTEPAGAERVVLRQGDRVELQVTMHAVPSVHVTLPASVADRAHGIRMPMFQSDVFGALEQVQPLVEWHMLGDPRNQTREMIVSLAPGQYQAQFMGSNGMPERVAQVNATGETATLDVAEAVQQSGVRGVVAMADHGSLPQFVGVRLMPEHGEARGGRVESNGEFHMEGLPPGRYRVTIVSSAGRMGLARMTANGVAVPGGVLTVGSDPVALNVSVIAGTATVAGEVHRGDVAASGVFVLLVPDDRHAPAVPNQSDSDGTFEFRNVLPGAYTAVAVEDGWTLNWQSRDVLRRYMAGGQRITAPQNAMTLSLPGPVRAQAK